MIRFYGFLLLVKVAHNCHIFKEITFAEFCAERTVFWFTLGGIFIIFFNKYTGNWVII